MTLPVARALLFAGVLSLTLTCAVAPAHADRTSPDAHADKQHAANNRPADPQSVPTQNKPTAPHRPPNDGTSALGSAITDLHAQIDVIGSLLNTAPPWSEYNRFVAAVEQAFQGDATPIPKALCTQIESGATHYFHARGRNAIGHPGTQLQAAALIQIALRCDQSDLYNLSLRAISRALPNLRERGVNPQYRAALKSLADDATRTCFVKGDMRLLVPFFETLVAIGDTEGLARATQGVQAGNPDVGLQQLKHYSDIATNAAASQ